MNLSTLCARRPLLLSGLFALVLPSTALIALPPTPPEAVQGTLQLKNGDFVAGYLDSSDDATVIRWKSLLFKDSIAFDAQGVSRIQYGPERKEPVRNNQPPARNPIAGGFFNLLDQLPRMPAQPVEGSRIELVGGHVLLGIVESLDEQFLQLDCQRHGKLRIGRSKVVDLDGLASNASLLFEGSGNLAAWTVLSPTDFDLTDWQAVGRDLVTTKLGANLFHQPKSGSRFLYELELAGRGEPQFQLVFGLNNSLNDIKNGFSIETWGQDLVIHRQAGKELVHRELTRPQWTQPDWSLTLDVYLDADARKLSVFSRGKLIGELKTDPPLALRGRGLLIQNRGTELRVVSARMRQFAVDQRVKPVDQSTGSANDLVVLADGSWLSGTVRSFDKARNQLLMTTADGPMTLEASRVDRIQLVAAREAKPVNAPPVQVAYLDGGALGGRYVRVDRTGLWLATDFSDEPVLAGWINLRDVRFNSGDPPDVPSTKNGLVEHSGCRVHGRVLNGDGPTDLLWEAVYSDHPVAFLSARTTRVSFEPRKQHLDADRLTSELSLINGDTIPCEIEAIDERAVIARFAAGQSARVPRESFKALRDFHRDHWVYPGFAAGDRWFADMQDAKSFRLRDGALDLMNNVRLAREMQLPDRFRVSFDVRFWTNSSLVVGVGCDTVKHALDRAETRAITEEMLKAAVNEKPDNLIEMTITRSGRAVTAHGLSRVSGVLAMLFRANMLGRNEPQETSIALGEHGTIHIEWLVDRPGRQYVITGNGKEMFRWRDPTPLEGNVLHFGCAPTDDGQSLASSNVADPKVSIYNFRVDRWPGDMASEHRERFLTRRRGTSEEAVTHALRAANGDSLRGRLIAMHDDQIVFQSRLDTLTVPRSAMAEIISLKPLLAPATTNTEQGKMPIRVTLWGGGMVTLDSLRATDRYVLGESPLAGLVSVPWSAVATIEFGGSPMTRPEALMHWVLRDPPPLPNFDAATVGEPSPWLNKPIPDFNISLLDGQELAMANLRGRPVILDFWATWCGPCIVSMPTMMELANEFEGKVELIAINQQEDAEEVRAFVESRLWKLRVGLDPDGSLNRLFGVNAIPYTLIIDRDGIVRHAHVGAAPNLKDELTEVLKGLVDP